MFDECEDFRDGAKYFGNIPTCNACCIHSETYNVRQQGVLDRSAEFRCGAEDAAAFKAIFDRTALLSAEAEHCLPTFVTPLIVELEVVF